MPRPRPYFPSLCDCGQTAWQKASASAVIFVDAADKPLLDERLWAAQRGGYAMDKDHRSLHRVIAKPPRGLDVDHQNRNRLDCRRTNLRVCCRAENLFNRPAPKKAKRYSPYKGVTKSRQRWIAQISAHREYHYLGTFDTAEEAAAAYDAAAKQHHGEFAYLNFAEAA